MIPNSFCHLPGVGLRSEQRLWDDGVRSWETYLEMGERAARGRKGRSLVEHIHASIGALDDRDARYFADGLPSGEQWRLFGEFRRKVAYLDIETTGLSADMGSAITTIALYDGERVRHYINGRNLRQFRDDIAEYDLLVTYNGKCFDVPFIERYFMISLPQAHIDLRYVLHGLGYSGGLKSCEQQLGIERDDLEGVDGYFAVLLWHDYQNGGNERALETLLAYNIADTVNLERLMIMAYNMKLDQTPFAHEHALRFPAQVPESGFRADRETVERLRRQYQLEW